MVVYSACWINEYENGVLRELALAYGKAKYEYTAHHLKYPSSKWDPDRDALADRLAYTRRVV